MTAVFRAPPRLTRMGLNRIVTRGDPGGASPRCASPQSLFLTGEGLAEGTDGTQQPVGLGARVRMTKNMRARRLDPDQLTRCSFSSVSLSSSEA